MNTQIHIGHSLQGCLVTEINAVVLLEHWLTALLRAATA